MLILSDIHMADGGPSDEFRQGGAQIELLHLLQTQPDHSVILLGDILDLLRCYIPDIWTYWGPLMDLLFQKARYWIAGNHDAEALSFMDAEFMDVPVRRILILGDSLFLHGDLFDPDHIKRIGSTVTQVEDWIVRQTGPRVGELGREIEAFIRGGRDGEMGDYSNRAFDFVSNFWIEEAKIKRIIIVHTHRQDKQIRDGIEYRNTGCWIGGHADYLEV